MADPILLSKITEPDKASSLFTKRRSDGAKINRLFFEGDHYQGSDGYMGQLPPKTLRFYANTIAEIEAGFVSENVIKEIIEGHLAGTLGREVIWGFLPQDVPPQRATNRRKIFSKLFQLIAPTPKQTPGNADRFAQEADEATTAWWDKRRPRNVLKDALIGALLEDRVVVNFFFPPVKGAGSDLPSALLIPRLRILTSDVAGVFVDADTEEEFGVYVYTDADEKQTAELTFIRRGQTILQILKEKQAPVEYSFELGGRLLMYEFRRDALITEQIRSNQRALNLDLTSMMRNVNLAGNLERSLLNVEKPTKKVRIPDATTGDGFREEIVDAEIEVGPGATMAYQGSLIRNDAGEVIGRANPNVIFRQPVEVKTFTDTHDKLRALMLSQAQQTHKLISGDATASGRSREQARAEFKSSLMLSKEVVDDCGRWMLETELRLGAQICNRTANFIGLRCEFNSIIEDGPIDNLDRQENRADVQAGLMAEETAMSRNGIEDTDAELDRIRTEAAERAKNAPTPTMPPLKPGQPAQQPPLIG